jgi:hypothetical protein
MPEHEEPTIIERITQAILRQALGRITKSAERFVKRMVRLVAMVLAGVVLAVLGIGFLAVGAVKWFSILMPNWLAWVIVGVILLLLGAVLTLSTMIGLRS